MKSVPTRTPMSFTFEPQDVNRITVVHVGKILDFRNADAFKAACQQQVQAGTQHFILDFSETDLLDSVGLGALFSLYRHLSPDGQVALAAPHGSVEVLIKLTKIDRIFGRYPSIEAARQQMLATT